MDNDQKKTLFFAIILGAIFVIAIFYMLFNAFLNKGTISLIGETPFLVEIVGGAQTDCQSSPCEITAKRGYQNLIIAKEKHNTIFKEVKVRLWETREIELKFELIPQIESTNEVLPPDQYYNYSLVYDENEHLYKLVSNADRSKRPIVYFSKEIKNPQIFGGKQTVLIIGENGSYKIDTIEQTKTQISNANYDLTEILSGHFSEKSDYFAFRLVSSPNIFVLNSANKISRTELIAQRSLTVWTYDNKLLFITDQKFDASNMPLSDASTDGFYIGTYDPINNSYQKIKSFSEILEKPKRAIITGNNNAIYLETGSGNYKISLE
ncbi:hypothetical protein HY604_04480 [Candidatus Peregrinibacteria bacterium]|nr:hypothetical protein [Candidatus Peregrinibacteria bacterium]